MRPPSPPQPSWLPAIAVVVLIALAVAGYFGWQHHLATRADAAAVQAPAIDAAELPATPAPAPVASEPGIQHPVEPPAADTATAAPLPPLADSDAQVSEALTALVTRKNVLSFFQLDGFVRRAVATVDNLPRTQAPVSVWPVNPTPQRFTTQADPNGQLVTIASANHQRYTPLVNMVEAVDTAQAVAVYRRLYPLFQQAYEELGFPGRYFNDRLVQVLDHLIATPLPTGPLAVKLVEVKGEVPSTRPWVRYEYADPMLEAQSAGRKMLWRTGADNQRRLQAKLQDIRQRIARP